MELMHVEVVTAGIVLLIVALFLVIYFGKRKKSKYSTGTRAANTGRIKATDLYKKLAIRYRLLTIFLLIASVGGIISSLVLAARPFRTENVEKGVRQRDIILNLDVSYSLYDLNYELVDYLKGVVGGLEGDRFGINIFNTSSVTFVPLTDDYDYVLQRLDELDEYFALQKEYMEEFGDYVSVYDMTDEEFERFEELAYALEYFQSGTLTDNAIKGSSLIGEGLGTALYSFPYLEESDRTRVIIMCTDNELNALSPQIVDLNDAAGYCKQYDVTLFGIFPNEDEFAFADEYSYTSCYNEFENACEYTGGKAYIRSEDQSVSKIVNDIQKQEAMVVKAVMSTKTVDMPEAPFIILIISLILFSLTGLVLQR